MRPTKADIGRAFVACLDLLCVLLVPVLFLLRVMLWIPRRQLKLSIWTGQPIITLPKKCAAEKTLGFRSFTVVRSAYYITHDFDLVISELAGGSRVLTILLSYMAFMFICLLGRQVHAFVDGGLLPSRRRRMFSWVELSLYRILGIHLLLWTYGGDVRVRETTRHLGEPNCCTDCDQIKVACICDEKEARVNLRRLSAASSSLFSMGDMIEYTGNSRNDLYFWPVDLAADGGARYRPAYPDGNPDRPLRIVHAPNHRQFKGTSHLERAVEILQREGMQIELVMVQRVSNAEALRIYRTADVIFDQCLIGYHGYFALEAMALGKPVICYIRKPKEYLLAPEECPIINTHIDTLVADLRRVVIVRQDLPAIGEAGRRYVEKYFSLEAFTARLRGAYSDMGIAA